MMEKLHVVSDSYDGSMALVAPVAGCGFHELRQDLPEGVIHTKRLSQPRTRVWFGTQ